jgi:hypothetical protein
MSVSKYDYDTLEREYIESDLSVRALADKHGIKAWSAVNAQKNKRRWDEKRADYRARLATQTNALTAKRTAEKIAAINDDFLSAVHAAIVKMGLDMRDRVVEEKQLDREGNPVTVTKVVPGQLITPDGLAKLLDRYMAFIGKPSSITEERNLGLSFSADGLPPDLLGAIAELTRGSDRGATVRTALPGARRPDPN